MPVDTSDPIRVSWTKLRTFAECPAKAELMRHHKSPVSDIRNYFPGQVADRVMGAWLSFDEPPPGWMISQVDEFLEAEEIRARDTGDGVVRWRNAGDKAEVRAFLIELLTRLEVILQEYCLPFDWVPHWRFQVPVMIDGREILLVGETDLLVFDSTGRLAIWDLKATTNNQYYQKVLGQIAFYWIAAKAHTWERLGRWPSMSGLIQPMCDQRVLPISVGMDDIRQMMGRIEGVARDIIAGRTAPKPGDQCGRCEVRHACPVFKITGSGRTRIAV